jgi:GT2 family glycosyltransferase
MPALTLSVVIVTRDRKDELGALLQDLLRLPFGADDEIAVVDNGSRDGTPGAVKAGFPGVRLIPMSENRGAPAGRNAGAAATRGDILVFLDDDTRVEDPGFPGKIRAAFQERGEAGVLAFRILDPVTRRPRRFEIPRRCKEKAMEPCETSYFISAGCAVRRNAFEALGGMDESLQYGFEELDFSYRAVSRGYRIFYRPEIVLIHTLSGSGRPGWRKTYYFYRNKIWISARYLPWPMAVSQVAVWSGYFLKESLFMGRPDVFLAALASGIAGIPDRLRRRRRDKIPREALLRLRETEGRLYY